MPIEVEYEDEKCSETKLAESLRRTCLLSRSAEHRPLTRLAAGIFCQAANDLQKFRYERRYGGPQLYADAREWVASNDRAWPYSFLNLCDALHLTPQMVRTELLAEDSLFATPARI